jgi:hypothetical protein
MDRRTRAGRGDKLADVYSQMPMVGSLWVPACWSIRVQNTVYSSGELATVLRSQTRFATGKALGGTQGTRLFSQERAASRFRLQVPAGGKRGGRPSSVKQRRCGPLAGLGMRGHGLEVVTDRGRSRLLQSFGCISIRLVASRFVWLHLDSFGCISIRFVAAEFVFDLGWGRRRNELGWEAEGKKSAPKPQAAPYRQRGPKTLAKGRTPHLPP